jgi:aryl-alcohol dehydrogenase-like predicted oxidoreductase
MSEDQRSFEPLISLGKTDLLVSPLGLGTWQWGDRMLWGYGQSHTDSDIRATFDVSLSAGINFFDSAEVYGNGRSERFLGDYIREVKSPLVIATKFMPFPWRFWKGSLQTALHHSLGRLDRKQVDLYQIHWPFPPRSAETWANALADAVEAGLTRTVGVSNYSASQMFRAHSALLERGIPLASNQVEYHLLNRKVERNGLLKLCQELGIRLISYSPLAKGLLTGKYTPASPPPGIRGRTISRSRLKAIQPLLQRMREVGQAHGRKTPAQVALNWLICKGTIPIPGAKNANQAQENAGALGWRLTTDEVAALDEMSSEIS